MRYIRMAIEKESPEQLGYDRIRNNLTESSVRDRSLRDLGVVLDDLLLPYPDHRGDRRLRDALAEMSRLEGDDILVTAGASAALFIIATALLERGDHLVVARPNYATNIETPRAIGASISFLDLTFEEGFRLDMGRLARLIGPETKYVSLTAPHNPTGVTFTEGELKELIALVESRGSLLLLDETYREMAFGRPLPVAASLSDRVVSVSSLSKTYGIPGIRTGWIACRNRELMERFLCGKEQIGICGSVLDETVAFHALAQRRTWLPENDGRIARAFDRVRTWMEGEDHFEWVRPAGGCVCFPRIRPDLPVDIDAFYRILNEKYGTYVGPGHWFEMDRRHMRIGYGWPLEEELEAGLASLSKAVREAMRD